MSTQSITQSFHLAQLFLLLLATGFATGASAQQIVNGGKTDQSIHFEGFSMGEGSLSLNYDIPFGGMVEFDLYDGTGKRVWRKQVNAERGKGRVVLRTAAFKAGEDYSFRFKYKLSEVKGALPATYAAVD